MSISSFVDIIRECDSATIKKIVIDFIISLVLCATVSCLVSFLITTISPTSYENQTVTITEPRIYVTIYGECYHSEDCTYLYHSKIKNLKIDNCKDTDDEIEDYKRQANFVLKIAKMPEKQALEIFRKAEEQELFISSLEQSVSDQFYPLSEEFYQQQFFEDTDWFYPDEDYIKTKKC